MPAPSNEAIEAHLSDLLKPLVHHQLGYYRQLGLRARILGLPLMVAAVLTLLWRQVPSVRELDSGFGSGRLTVVQSGECISTSSLQEIFRVSGRNV
jgi:hypothetical protein